MRILALPCDTYGQLIHLIQWQVDSLGTKHPQTAFDHGYPRKPGYSTAGYLIDKERAFALVESKLGKKS